MVPSGWHVLDTAVMEECANMNSSSVCMCLCYILLITFFYFYLVELESEGKMLGVIGVNGSLDSSVLIFQGVA